MTRPAPERVAELVAYGWPAGSAPGDLAAEVKALRAELVAVKQEACARCMRCGFGIEPRYPAEAVDALIAEADRYPKPNPPTIFSTLLEAVRASRRPAR